ncbi:MAG: proline--tRNA ligase [Magnetococcales bacterium]|nr:proline--tRNA ligase [Magnetococcales bacterium]
MSQERTVITPTRQANFPEWYQEVIRHADLAEHSVVRGCMVIKPWGYAIWELIQQDLDRRFKETGHQNAYFPLLIPMSFLEKEAQHVEGFAKECAVVTHYRLEGNGEGGLRPAPGAQLTEPMIIRPTSETIIGHSFAKWLTSYNDLPILINQWANVMRWEMRTRLFLRTSEFLWQEGHTAHATDREAVEETMRMLDVYEQFARDRLAMPVIKGEKTPGERFPGAVDTYCIEAMMQDGKALQAGTSHFLGQNFSRAYDIGFTGSNQQRQLAWTTSWGVSTRLIGGMIMTHSDDDGLVLPPAIAPAQIVLLPVAKATEMEQVLNYCQDLSRELSAKHYAGQALRVHIDRSNLRGGDKFWKAVGKGYPLRVEIGGREMAGDTLTISRRDQSARERTSMPRQEFLQKAPFLLQDIHDSLLARATRFRDDHSVVLESKEEMERFFDRNEAKVAGFVRAPFHLDAETDPAVIERMKELKLSVRCLPLGEQGRPGRCLLTGKETRNVAIIARSY